MIKNLINGLIDCLQYTQECKIKYPELPIRVETAVGNRRSRLIGFTTKQNLHDFRYEGGAPHKQCVSDSTGK